MEQKWIKGLLTGILLLLLSLGGQAIFATDRGFSPTPMPVASAAAPASQGQSPKPLLAIEVTVWGKVQKPGLVRLPEGATVADAIAAAGGASKGAALSGLHLQAPLKQGDFVEVP